MDDALDAPTEFPTPRLLLRKPRLEDAGPLFRAYASDEQIVRFMTWRAHEAEEQTLAFVRSCPDEWSQGTGYPYLIEVKGDPAGPVSIVHLHDRGHALLFGYLMARPYWGRGYMAEALSTVVNWSLDQPRIWRAAAFCDAENLASARVMEKSGMAFEGILRRYGVHPNVSSEPRDYRMYAKVRS